MYLSDQNLGALGDMGLAILLKEVSAILADARPVTEDFAGKDIAVGVGHPESYGSEAADQIPPTYVPLQALLESQLLTRFQDYATGFRLA